MRIGWSSRGLLSWVVVAALALSVGACIDVSTGDDEENGVTTCEGREIDLTDGSRPTLGVAGDSGGEVITECGGDDESAPYTLLLDERPPLELEVRTAMAAQRTGRDEKDLLLDLSLGPWSVDEAEEKAAAIVDHLGMERSGWIDEWVAEARAAPEAAQRDDVRSRVLTADLADDIDASLDVVLQSTTDNVFVHLTIRWTTA